MLGRRGQVELCCKIPLSAQHAELRWPLLFLSSSPLCRLVQEVPKSKLAGLSCPTWKQALKALSCNICLAFFALYISCPQNMILKALIKTLPKAQRTLGLSSAYQSNFFRSYHKFWSNIFRISAKHQLQNLNQTSAFRRNLNLKILAKPSFRISTKIKLHNHNQASAAK